MSDDKTPPSTPAADNPAVQSPSNTLANQSVDYKSELKPVAGWKTAITKVGAAVGMIGSTVAIALGAAFLFKGRSISKQLTKVFGDGTTEAGHELAAFGTKAGGGAAVLSGATGAAISKAQWDSAAGATRARNLAEIKDKVDGLQASQGRA